jgi:Leucine-rich repeat (LRR) protein
LDVSRTGLTSLPAALAQLRSLQILDATSNAVQRLPAGQLLGSGGGGGGDVGSGDDGAEEGGPRLRALLLSDNKLAAIDGAGDSTDELALELLHLAGNQLEAIPPELMRRLTAARVLDARANSISELDSGALLSMGALEVLALDDNPLSADASSTVQAAGKRGVAVDEESRKACARTLSSVDYDSPCANELAGGANASAAVGGSNATDGCPATPRLATLCAR